MCLTFVLTVPAGRFAPLVFLCEYKFAFGRLERSLRLGPFFVELTLASSSPKLSRRIAPHKVEICTTAVLQIPGENAKLSFASFACLKEVL